MGVPPTQHRTFEPPTRTHRSSTLSCPAMNRLLGCLGVGSLSLLTLACGGIPEVSASASSGAYVWDLPTDVPRPWVPADNVMSEAKVELGRHFFYDERLSINGTLSCASCHRQELAFSDGEVTALGATGDQLSRNSMSLTNVAYFYPYTWSNSVLHTLEDQALVPMFGERPLELGLTGKIDPILAELAQDPAYERLIADALPQKKDLLGTTDVAAAISAFERTLLSFDSPFDRYASGKEPDAISESAARGFAAFNSEKFECYHCHSGLNFTSAFRAEASQSLAQDYQNNGLYNLNQSGAYPPESPGLVAVTGRRSDSGKFRVPTLRNIAKTAPYMHDGSIATLGEVLDHYAAGGRLIEQGPHQGDGRQNPFKSPFVRAVAMTAEEKQDLLAFLESLTDVNFLTSEKLSNPFR
jgi:cytochrome c peroxidase